MCFFTDVSSMNSINTVTGKCIVWKLKMKRTFYVHCASHVFEIIKQKTSEGTRSVSWSYISTAYI